LAPDRFVTPRADGGILKSAAVIGLGLIGGSVARELSVRGIRVLGYDRDKASVQAALRDGGIHVGLNPELEGIDTVDVVVVAVPVAAAPGVLQTALPHLKRVRLITDVGSTKRTIGNAAETLGIGERFVGSHPLAGDHCSGWSASRLGLFDGARVSLCPTADTSERALDLAREFWEALGARPGTIDAAEHDRRLAWTSHLPQTVSTALALALAGTGIQRDELGPGGRDMTRLAGSSPGMWTDIALDNAAELGNALSSLEQCCQQLRAALAAQDRASVQGFFAAGQHWNQGGG
jgi:prephenate dehydrogenase